MSEWSDRLEFQWQKRRNQVKFAPGYFRLPVNVDKMTFAGQGQVEPVKAIAAEFWPFPL